MSNNKYQLGYKYKIGNNIKPIHVNKFEPKSEIGPDIILPKHQN